MNVDVVIIGAGPAGLVASIELAKRDLQVVVVDEYYRSGGRLLGQFYEDRKENKTWNGQKMATDLTNEAKELGVQLLIDCTVWKIEHKTIFVSHEEVDEIQTKSIILATGAIEKALPLPGWQKVGAFSIGAAQTFTNLHHVNIGEKVLFVGIDPLSISVAIEMKTAGVDVLGMMLPAPSPVITKQSMPKEVLEQVAKVADMAPNWLFRQGGKLVKGKLTNYILKLLKFNALKVNGIPIYFQKAVTSINGASQVESVTVRNLSIDGKLLPSEQEIEVDTVCLSGGLLPLIDIPQVANCILVDIPQLGGIVPLHNKYLKTTVPGVYVAGNVTGIEGAKVAMAQGKLAAYSLMKDKNLVGDDEVEKAYLAVEEARTISPISFLPTIHEGRQIMQDQWKAYTMTLGDEKNG